MKGKSSNAKGARSATAAPTIIDEVATFLRRFISLPEETYYQLIAAWVLGTHLLDVFEYFGYLLVYSRIPQSGKSKLLEVLNELVFASSGILVSPTEAILFRTAAGRTQLIDEIDSHLSVETLRNVLNAGYQKGASVERCDKVDGTYVPKKHPVYGARALAGIGEKTLHETTRQRTFSIEMVRQKRGDRERFRPRKVRADITELKSAISNWVQRHQRTVAQSYEKASFDYLEQFQDRTVDVAEPLATIVETVYASHPRRLRTARAALVIALGKTRKENSYLARDEVIFKQLRQLADENDPLVGTATELARLCGMHRKDSIGVMSQTLRRYGFKTKSIRKQGVSKQKKGMPKHRYRLSRTALTDVFRRYFGERSRTK